MITCEQCTSSSSSSSSLGSRCVPWLAEGLVMPFPNYPVLCCPLPYRVAPVFVQVVSPPLGWSPLSYFLGIWSPSGDARGPSVVFEAVDMPCPGPFHFSHSAHYIYDFCLLPDLDVGISIFVCDVEHTSFHFGLYGREFVLGLFGQCPGICTICHSWQHTGPEHLSLHADDKVAFEDIPVFGVCRPACRDSSLYLFVLVLFLEAVVLSQVHVAMDIFYQHSVHVYKGVVYNHHLCLFDVHLKTHSPTFIVSSCSICCSYCGVSLHWNMSSAERILEKNYPSIFTPLFLQFNFLNITSNVAVNSLGEMVSLCLTPLLIMIISLTLCRCSVTELSVYMSFRMYMYKSSIPCSCNDVNIAWICTESNAFS